MIYLSIRLHRTDTDTQQIVSHRQIYLYLNNWWQYNRCLWIKNFVHVQHNDSANVYMTQRTHSKTAWRSRLWDLHRAFAKKANTCFLRNCLRSNILATSRKVCQSASNRKPRILNCHKKFWTHCNVSLSAQYLSLLPQFSETTLTAFSKRIWRRRPHCSRHSLKLPGSVQRSMRGAPSAVYENVGACKPNRSHLTSRSGNRPT